MRQILLIFMLLFAWTVQAQENVLELNPSSVQILNLSSNGEKEFNENYEAGMKIMQKLSDGTKYDDLSEEEKATLMKVDETMESYWDIIGGGCSWYCGGGPEKVTASSALSSQGNNSYEAQNAHDLNYKEAWVEGVSGYGIGEYLEYHFAPISPRITEINVVNGYVKSESAWKNNSRVKKLKVYLNDKPYLILNLKDKRAVQTFKVEPIGHSERKDWDKLKEMPAWTLKFEIMEVYKGLKFDDVVISEIFFDGLDVHCFAAGTKILLDNGELKNIEELVVGDKVKTYLTSAKKFESAKIEKLEKVIHDNLVTYIFENNIEITSTKDHPFLTETNEWASLQPEKSRNYNGFEKINNIKIGNKFWYSSEKGELILLTLKEIKFLKGEQVTYTISKLDKGDTFVANGFVVGVEELK